MPRNKKATATLVIVAFRHFALFLVYCVTNAPVENCFTKVEKPLFA
jgi:hypothetical protein